ncbi:MAG: hypothetical protein JKY01_11160 [Pseudomonadales bacterium]|nr:hypothetical protein [Pseudomonadales bacterium]
MKEIFVFFKRLIDADTDSLRALILTIDGVEYVDNTCRFTIRGLFHSLDGGSLSYEEFRSQLYAGTLNADLKKRGYQIQVCCSSGNVDTSWYRLVKLGEERFQ